MQSDAFVSRDGTSRDRRGRAYLECVIATETISCACGLVVLSDDELHVIGFCWECSAQAPEDACDCVLCMDARARSSN